MRRTIMLAAPLLLMGLSGCVAPPPPGVYGYPGAYSQPGYPAAYAQPGYPVAPYADAGDIYPGYNYNAGAPSIVVEGASVPLIYYGGSWGYYDGYRRFHRAPESVWRHLETRHPGGYGVRPYAASAYPRPDGPRFGGERPFGPRGFERPAEGSRFEGQRFEGQRFGGDRPFGGRAFERPPEASRGGGFQPPPGGGFQSAPGGRFGGPALAMPPRPEGRPGPGPQFQQGGPPRAQGVSMAPPPRQAPPPQAPQGGGGGHNCWPGQRC